LKKIEERISEYTNSEKLVYGFIYRIPTNSTIISSSTQDG